MVLPFIPPKFPTLKKGGDSLLKPSEYLKSIHGQPEIPSRGPTLFSEHSKEMFNANDMDSESNSSR